MNGIVSQIRYLRDRIKHPVMRLGRSQYRVNTPYISLGSPEYHTFVGYYDIQPFDPSGTKLLAGRCPSSHNGRAMDTPLEIGYFDLKTQVFTSIGTTQLWCWQMGCRLQWVNWEGQELILYNDIDSNAPRTILFNPENNQIRTTFPLPTYCISPDARFIISLDFNNLEQCRGGYGYDWQQQTDRQTDATLVLYDTTTKEQKTLLSTQQLRTVNPHPSMGEEGVFHYFNHIHFNPSGTRILCFHIWNTPKKRHVRAITMNVDGSDIRDVTKGDHVSHYWWLNDQEILLYGTDPKEGQGYHVYDQSGRHIKKLDKHIPRLDGHPHARAPQWFVSDNVVNKRFERDLWLYDIGTQARIDLAAFYSPPQFSGEIRCDLHPRLSRDGQKVAVDSAHAGYRQIIVLDIQTSLQELQSHHVH